MRLTDRVYLVGSGAMGFSLTDDCDCHVYLIDGGSQAALIDAGGGRDGASILKNIEDDGVPLGRIHYLLLTHGHADHAAGAAWLRRELGLKVLVGHEIAGFLRRGDEHGISLDVAKQAGLYPPDFAFPACPVDGELVDGQEITVGDCELVALSTPGHAAGCLSYRLQDSGKQYLFAGDAVFFGGAVALQNVPDCDLQACSRSIEKLARLSIDVFLPGHLCFSLRDGQRHIDAAMGILRRLGVPPNLTCGG